MRLLLFVFLLTSALNVAAQSSSVNDLFATGTRHASAGRFESAVDSYKSALLIAENEYLAADYRARLRYNIGVCYLRLDRFDLAKAEFKSAILLKKDYSDAHYALEISRSRKRDWERQTSQNRER